MKTLKIVRKAVSQRFLPLRRKGAATPLPRDLPAPESFAKDFVFYTVSEGKRAILQLQAKAGDGYLARICIPSENGALVVNDEEILVSEKHLQRIGEGEIENESGIIRGFDHSIVPEVKGYEEVRSDKKRVLDYSGVKVTGYASTFAERTPIDRDGDTIKPGAFNDTIAQFKTNPVTLMDHRNSVHEVAGSFNKVVADRTGLAVEGTISDAPGLRDIRFKLVEGHIKAFSIGGLLRFDMNTAGLVDKVTLFEISLVAVPANQDALFIAKHALVIEDSVKMATYMKRLGTLSGIATKMFA